MKDQFRAGLFSLIGWLHHLDFKLYLPMVARLPLWFAYTLSNIRGSVNRRFCRDWRSVALKTRHIKRQTLAAYGLLPGNPTRTEKAIWLGQRFATEAREEFEARLVAAKRMDELRHSHHPSDRLLIPERSGRGLVLLTLHFDSFILGGGFLAQSGRTFNFMSSAITHDPRLDTAVQNHFEAKYRGLEAYLNGGKIVDMESGMRPFYKMLAKHQVLIILGDSPPLKAAPSDTDMVVDFLGEKRRLAGGALRIAQSTDSDIGAYLCYYVGKGEYRVEICPPRPANEPHSVQGIYDFFSRAILKDPGLWWGADLLPSMPKEPNI